MCAIEMVQQKPDTDRGWAWVVLASAYSGLMVFSVAMYMNGVLFLALLEKFQEGEAKTALIGAISTGLQCFLPLLGGVINNKFSCRVSIVLGGILTTLGYASSAFMNSLDLLIVTSGVCVGIGFGLSASGLICSVGFYFEKLRNIVLSCAFLSVGFAMFISSPFGLLLINTYGLNATYLIVACIEAQMCVLGMLCKPSSIEIDVHRRRIIDKKRESKSVSKTLFDLTLLRNKPYLLFLISSTTWTFALSSAVMHLPNYVHVQGGTIRDIGFLMTSFSVANLFGRLCGAATVSKQADKSLYVHVTALGVAGVMTSLFILYSKWTFGTYLFAVQLGILTGLPNAMMTPLSLSFVGVEKMSEAYGLASFFCGMGLTSGPIVTGYLYSVTKIYENSFVVAGGILIAGSLFGVSSLCCRSPRKENTKDFVVVVVAKNSTLSLGNISEEKKLTDFDLDSEHSGFKCRNNEDADRFQVEELLSETKKLE